MAGLRWGLVEWQQEDCECGFEVDGFEVLEGADRELEGSGVIEAGGKFREDFGEQPGDFEELKGSCSGGVREHAAEFLEDAFDADAVDLGALLLDGEQGLRVECEGECCCEADSS
jgi:hypothetical protein